MQVNIYNIESGPFHKYLGQLLDKTLHEGHKVLVKCINFEQMQQLNSSLWSYEALSFLPHCIQGNPKSSQFPIYLCDNYEAVDDMERDLLVITAGDKPDPKVMAKFTKIVDIFNQADIANGEGKAEISQRIQAYKDLGWDVSYWYKGTGAWQKLEAPQLSPQSQD